MSFFPAVLDLPESSFSVHRTAARGRRRGFVVLLHELWGIVPQIIGTAERFAAEGFETYIPEILPGTLPPTAEQDRIMARFQVADDAQVVRRVSELVRRLRLQDPSVPVILAGYCFGGRMAIHAAARVKVDGVVVFYGSLKTTPNASGLDVLQSAANIEVPVQAHYGQEDTGSPPDEVAQLSQALRLGKVFVYEGAGHAFANETRDSFRADAATLAWARVLDFITARELSYRLTYRAPVVESWELSDEA